MVLQFPSLKTLLMTFLFVIGHGPPPVRTASFEAVQAAARTAVIAGPSIEALRRKDIEELGYWVNVIMTIENWSRFPLNSRNNRVHSGSFFYGTGEINPGKREVLAFLNGDLVGSYGTVSFLVSGANRRFVIMWSAPYLIANGGYRNWMALGMTSVGRTSTDDEYGYFDEMYENWGTWYLKFDRKEFYWKEDPVNFSNDQFVLWGKMAPTRKAHITIVFRPLSNDDLAPQIKEELQKAS
uniref:Coluporin-25 n=1 Tax=Colubraria reticulata TaxID=604273 RepID=A0A499RJC8_9CAEN|nr:coluporin-25 [Colubraria reticulata]